MKVPYCWSPLVGWVGFKGRHSTLTQAPLAAEHHCCAKNVLGFLGGGHIGSLSDRSIVHVSDGLCDWAVVSSHVWALRSDRLCWWADSLLALSQHNGILSKKTAPFQNDPKTAICSTLHSPSGFINSIKIWVLYFVVLLTRIIMWLWLYMLYVIILDSFFLICSQIHVTSCALGFTLLAQLCGVMTCVAMTAQKMEILSLHFSMGCELC